MDLRNDQETMQKLASNELKPITTEEGERLAKIHLSNNFNSLEVSNNKIRTVPIFPNEYDWNKKRKRIGI